MDARSPEARLEAVLSGTPPLRTLELARELKAEGMSQAEMLALFDKFRRDYQENPDEMKYDAIVDVMDLIVGWCSPGNGLFDSRLA